MHDVDVDLIPMDEWKKEGGKPKADFSECLRHTRALLEHSVHKPDELNARDVMAISYYFDRATDHGLIDATDGGTITIEQLFKSANQRKECLFNYDVRFWRLIESYISIPLRYLCEFILFYIRSTSIKHFHQVFISQVKVPVLPLLAK